MLGSSSTDPGQQGLDRVDDIEPGPFHEPFAVPAVQVVVADRGRVRLYTPGVRFQPPTESFWMRLKRFMLGVSTS